MKFIKENVDILPYGALYAMLFIVLTAAWIVGSHFEAKAYSELTGKEVTTWQAMWVKLRVDSD